MQRSRTGSSQLFGIQNGKGPPIHLIHGLAGSHRIFDPLVHTLEEDFMVNRFDLLGYGHSRKPRITYNPATHVEAIHDAVIHFALPKPFLIVGLSMGVDLVLEIARRWPTGLIGLMSIGICCYHDEVSAKTGLQHNVWTSLNVNHPLLGRVLIPPTWWLDRHSKPLSRHFSTIYTVDMSRQTSRTDR
jgi:pimeloyl-ACP methyl ester carboxylesterase